LVIQLGYDTLSYPAQLQAKLSELQDLVHSNLTQSAHSQKCHYDQHAKEHTFIPGDPVWLSIPTAGKLDPMWEGEWVIKPIKGPITVEIGCGKWTKVVHINRLSYHYIPGSQNATVSDPEINRETTDINHEASDWPPPLLDHVILPMEQAETPLYPQCYRRQPDH